ncbi:MAG: hypothetical protein WBP26_04960 [Candidatus Saccharimonadales bacterium]
MPPNLADQIRQYYLDNFALLPTDKQFHFAGRLYSWEHDETCRNHLVALKGLFTGDSKKITNDLADIIANPPQAKVNAATVRQPYFNKYPALRSLMLALFRVRHLQYLYDVDCRGQLLSVISQEKLRGLGTTLLEDKAALKVLSTYAINYLYLLELLFPEEESLVDAQEFYRLGKTYDTQTAENIQLYIYFYTHMIIGDTNFYERAVRDDRLSHYTAMLHDIEQLIQERFDEINLDNKLEFLVCCNICGYETSLRDYIYKECAESVSGNGTFLVDTFNSFQQSNKTSLSDSEHRNVLFIMSTSPYHAQPNVLQ